jgi:3-phosphoglycerate kinase
MKLSVTDLDLSGTRVFIRVDFNVPLKNGVIKDDTRVRASLPTIQHALAQGATVILASHLGRPKGKPNPEYSLKPVGEHLGTLLGRTVVFAEDAVGEPARKAVTEAQAGDKVVLLENLRFHAEEEKNDPGFAAELASLADVYVDDAFGSSHRAHASVEGIIKHVPLAAAGLLMEKELRYLGQALENPERPFVAILGGAKVSDKLGVIENLIPKVNRIVIGGAMAYTFLKARGKAIGNSRVEDDFMDKALQLLEKATEVGCEVMLPPDHVVVRKLEAGAEYRIAVGDIDPTWQAVDIGPMAAREFAEKVVNAQTIVWNGPMGVFEIPPFDQGTNAIAQAVATATEKGAKSVVGGGDSASAIQQLGLQDQISHISTCGGASLEFLEGKKFKAIEILDDK